MLKLLGDNFLVALAEAERHRYLQCVKAGRDCTLDAAVAEWLALVFPHWKGRHWQQAVAQALATQPKDGHSEGADAESGGVAAFLRSAKKTQPRADDYGASPKRGYTNRISGVPEPAVSLTPGLQCPNRLIR